MPSRGSSSAAPDRCSRPGCTPRRSPTASGRSPPLAYWLGRAHSSGRLRQAERRQHVRSEIVDESALVAVNVVDVQLVESESEVVAQPLGVALEIGGDANA